MPHLPHLMQTVLVIVTCRFFWYGRVDRVLGPQVGSVPGRVLLIMYVKRRQHFSKVQVIDLCGVQIYSPINDSLFMGWFLT